MKSHETTQKKEREREGRSFWGELCHKVPFTANIPSAIYAFWNFPFWGKR